MFSNRLSDDIGVESLQHQLRVYEQIRIYRRFVK